MSKTQQRYTGIYLYHSGTKGFSEGLGRAEIGTSTGALDAVGGALNELGIVAEAGVVRRLATAQVGVFDARDGTSWCRN
jgi:hypothetical protein